MSEKTSRRASIEAQLELIESLVCQDEDDHSTEFYSALLKENLKFCVKEIKDLLDENDSVWGMIEEIHAADIANHSDEFREMMDRKLAEIKILASMKPGLA